MAPRRGIAADGVLVLAGFSLTGTTWAIRVTGTHLGLRTGAYVERNEWAYAEISLAADGVVLSDTDRALLRTLHDDALFAHPAPPPLNPPFRALLNGD